MSFCVKGILFFFWEWVRALYYLFLHGSGRYVGSDDWVPLVLGSLDHYLHHHSRPTVACFYLSLLGWVVRQYHTLAPFLSWLFSLFSSALHSSYPLLGWVVRQCHFASWTVCPLAFVNLSFGTVHLYVGRVTMLTRFSDMWHCALRGLVLPFGYLSLVSHRFIHLLPLAFITVRVVRPPWGHEISCLLRHISFGQAPFTDWSTRCHPTSIFRGYRGGA